MFAEDIQLAILRLARALEEIEVTGSSTASATHTSGRVPLGSPPPTPLHDHETRAPLVTTRAGVTKVRLPRLTLKKCIEVDELLGLLQVEELLTSVSAVEMIINLRPLAYSSPEDIEEPLTPAHLLIGRRVLTQPETPRVINEDYETPTDHSELTRRMKHLNQIMDHVWRRWRHEYLLELRASHRYLARGRGCRGF